MMAQTDADFVSESAWGEIVAEWRDNQNMVVELKQSGRVPTKRILGLKEDSEPLDGIRVLSHTDTVPYRRFYAILEDQQDLDALRERLAEVATYYANGFMMDTANSARAFRKRLPSTFEEGRF